MSHSKMVKHCEVVQSHLVSTGVFWSHLNSYSNVWGENSDEGDYI